MAHESRQLPTTNISRLTALNKASLKNTAMGAGSFLTSSTQLRLGTTVAAYQTGYNAIAGAKHNMVVLTAAKNKALGRSRMFASHLVQVLNLAIEREVFPASDRAYYGLPVETGHLPEMKNEDDEVAFINAIILGETSRIAASGAASALAYPTLGQVQAEYALYTASLAPLTTATDAYDTALEVLENLNPEADKVIKKVWDEVETYYNEESESSMRQNAREWGVVYVLVGSTKRVSGIATDAATGLPVAGARVYFENGNKTATTNAAGEFELNTTLMNEQKLIAEHDLYRPLQLTVTLVENENLVQNLQMQQDV